MDQKTRSWNYAANFSKERSLNEGWPSGNNMAGKVSDWQDGLAVSGWPTLTGISSGNFQ